jgi:hypothetical protein
MTDDTLSLVLGHVGHADQEAGPLRCQELARTDRGWERCHCDRHNSGDRHHVRDRSWSTATNIPRLRIGQPCTQACTWPDQVMPYRGQLGRRA